MNKVGVAVGWIVLVAFVIAACCTIGPVYNVWQQQKEGQAELARAMQNRLIAVQEAEAKKEAASKLAEAEVARAYGVAKANQIIGMSLKGNEEYLRYLYIQALETRKGDVIYVPTEAGLPILEAGKRH